MVLPLSRRDLLLQPIVSSAHLVRPATLNEGERIPYVVVGQHFGKGRHVARVANRRVWRLEPEFRDREQHVVAVVPGVPRIVMRWRGHSTVRRSDRPVRLSFEIDAVAGRASPS